MPPIPRQCAVPPSELLAVTEPIFYDLYFYYDAQTSRSTDKLSDLDSGSLYPVPVRLKNLRADSILINSNIDTAGRPASFDDQLTRRFFTVDSASGVADAGAMPRVLRYIKSASLTATLRTADTTGGLLLQNRSA